MHLSKLCEPSTAAGGVEYDNFLPFCGEEVERRGSIGVEVYRTIPVKVSSRRASRKMPSNVQSRAPLGIAADAYAVSASLFSFS